MHRYFVFLILGLFTAAGSDAQQQRFRFSENKMGSPFNLIFYCRDSSEALRLSKKCFALVDSLNRSFSDYDPDSELSRICASGREENTSPAFWDILRRSQTAYNKSNGAFDITIGALSRLWRKARKEKRFPDSTEIMAAKKKIGFTLLKINTLRKSIQVPAGTNLDLGGIAKGYAAQAVVDFLGTEGIKEALADAGGDMVMSDAPDNTRGWVVGVNVPETTDELLPRKLLLHNMSVATSGDAYQFIAHNGHTYSHIIDPRTGYGISSRRNVTVIAANGTDADWLATACSILPIPEAKQLAHKMHAELLITVLENDIVVYHKTKGFDQYWKP